MPNSFVVLLILFFVALGIYYLLSLRIQNIWLLLVSYTFYFVWQWQSAVVLMGLTLANFVLGLIIERSKRRLLWKSIGITLNILTLAFFKYRLFVFLRMLNLSAGLGNQPASDTLAILVPVGLSFTVLQTISYLVDVGNSRLKAERNLIDFALYLAYFPKLLAGPIERANKFLEKLRTPRVVNNKSITDSFTLLLIGLFRKLVIANLLSRFASETLFKQPSTFTSPELWMGLISYSFLIYNDFAGYTGIARGISGLFGIELSTNFDLPYFSASVADFWNRWHMSFSFWLRDYIYFPISRWLATKVDRRHPINTILPPLVTMIISGMWHMASPNMLLWGAIHGTYLSVRRLPLPGKPSLPNQRPFWEQVIRASAVFLLVTLAWVPFRTDISNSLRFWKGLIIWRSGPLSLIPLAIILPSLVLDALQSSNEVVFARWPHHARAAAIALTLLAIGLVLLARTTGTPFIYQGF